MSKYAENHEKMLLNKLHKYIDEEEYKYESPYITKADVEVIITALENQAKIKESFEKWETDTGGFYGADDETTHLISALKKTLRSDK